MNKFRVISDLHLDVNHKHPFSLRDDGIFTVICGDTDGNPINTIEWIKKNVKSGVGVSGNHLPYNSRDLEIQKYREELADAFKHDDSFTYLDVETQTFAKEVDGIVFLGSCGYSNFRIKHPDWNPTGDQALNFMCSEWNMNDYRWGILKKTFPAGHEDKPSFKMMRAKDYAQWFLEAWMAFDRFLDENEKLAHPKPVVLITHHAWLKDTVDKNGYIEQHFDSRREFNWASYASDMQHWMISHPSIKCYCYGHIHDIYKDYRSFTIDRIDGSKILVVNNCRGYVSRGHDYHFNPNIFVNTKDWTLEIDPESEEELNAKKDRADDTLRKLALFSF